MDETGINDRLRFFDEEVGFGFATEAIVEGAVEVGLEIGTGDFNGLERREGTAAGGTFSLGAEETEELL